MKVIYSEKSQSLFESLRSARQKYPEVPTNILSKFVSIDSSGTYKYVEKMCELYSEGYNYLSICSIFKKYQKLEVFMDNKDITRKTYDVILDDIETSELRKINSRKEQRNRERQQGLIYNKNNIRVYAINNFADAQTNGKGTLWCTSLSEEKFNFYIKQYNIYIIFDLNRNSDDPFRKVCYLNGGVEDMFVDKNNIHYYESQFEYSELQSYYGKDLMKLLI